MPKGEELCHEKNLTRAYWRFPLPLKFLITVCYFLNIARLRRAVPRHFHLSSYLRGSIRLSKIYYYFINKSLTIFSQSSPLHHSCPSSSRGLFALFYFTIFTKSHLASYALHQPASSLMSAENDALLCGFEHAIRIPDDQTN